MDVGTGSQRSWARTERELAEAPLPELVPSGPVVGGTPLRLCYLVAAQNATGRLSFDEGEGIRHELFFKRGVPHQATSTCPGFGLLPWLTANGALDAAAAARAEAAGGDPLAALFQLGLLPPADAFGWLGRWGCAVFARALAAEQGSFTWEPDAPAPAGTFPLGEKWALLCEVGRRLDMDVVARRLGARIDCPVMRAGDGLVPIESLALNAHEARVVASLDGTRSLAHLAAASPGDAPVIYRTGLFLAELGLASFAKARLERPAGAPLPDGAAAAQPASAAPGSRGVGATAGPGARGIDASAGPGARSAGPRGVGASAGPSARGIGGSAGPGARSAGPRGVGASAGPSARGIGGSAGPGTRSAGPRGAGTSAGPSARGIGSSAGPGNAPRFPTDEAGLRAFLESLQGKNHFEVLGLPRSATPNLIKQSYFQRARAFHPDLAGTGGPTVRRIREEITARLNEAWSCLSDDERRRAYLAELDAGGAKQLDVANVLVAEQLFRQATVLVKTRRFAEAVAELDRAISLNPEEGEFYAWRGFARFWSALDKHLARDEAMAEIEHALSLNERCAPAWLFAARIATVVGDATGAIKYYRRCLAVDEANLEAQRELRLLESRMAK